MVSSCWSNEFMLFTALYDLQNDIGETKDLSKKMKKKRDELHKLLADWRKNVNAQMPVPDPASSP